MELATLVHGLDARLQEAASGAVRIDAITEDSRQVTPGSLFVARPGQLTDGRRFIAQALSKGARAILTDRSCPRPPDAGAVAWLVADDVPLLSAQLAERFFGHPSSALRLAGVTGTNGKTTVVHLLHQLLSAGDHHCGQIGTVQIDDAQSVQPASMTTPPALELSRLLANMVEAGCHAAAMEVSSHALAQHRVAALDFDAAVFTNLTGDHLDYHRSTGAYLAAKARLFSMLKPTAVAIINADDPAAQQIVRDCAAPVWRCTITDASGAECRARFGPSTLNGTEVTLIGPWGNVSGRSRLVGRFNVLNLLQAVAAAHALGASSSGIEATIGTLSPPPGRFERVAPELADTLGFVVLVDYAHTDDALRNALAALRPIADARNGSLQVVIGCGGERDKTKRPRMGSVACELADALFITSDNPRTEDPRAIIRDILEGVDPSKTDVRTDPDRAAAIGQAIDGAARGDIVLIAGKGHEEDQILHAESPAGVRRIDFDDRVVARQAMEKRAETEDSPATEITVRRSAQTQRTSA